MKEVYELRNQNQRFQEIPYFRDQVPKTDPGPYKWSDDMGIAPFLMAENIWVSLGGKKNLTYKGPISPDFHNYRFWAHLVLEKYVFAKMGEHLPKFSGCKIKEMTFEKLHSMVPQFEAKPLLLSGS